MNDSKDPLRVLGNTDAGQQPLSGGTDGTLRTSLDLWIDRFGKIVAWLVFVAMAISVLEVISRYAFDSPTSWVHETTVFMIAAIFALGGMTAMARDKHIRVRLIYDAVSPRVRRWLDIVNGVLTLAFCVGMSYAAYTLFWRSTHNPLGEWQLERSGTSWNPPFPALTKGVILFALVVMTLQAILHLVRSVRERPPASPDGPPEGR